MDFNKLIDLLRKKEKRGLEALYMAYGERLYDYAITRWRATEDEAWELIYKTLETILDKINKYEFESKKHFENFLYKVFTNNLRQLYRAKRRKEGRLNFISLSDLQIEDTEAFGVFEEESEISDVNLKQSLNEYYFGEGSKNQILILMRAALEKLSEDDRDILLLRSQNFSYKEIAEMLNTESEQLKVKYFRAKKKLVQLLKQESESKHHEKRK